MLNRDYLIIDINKSLAELTEDNISMVKQYIDKLKLENHIISDN